ncbi:hypothetical protein SAMN05216267_1008213 [Actinacidiphila rubida]|uniref:Uncharacterized protein n=1 Tax=Actinacidiphila rubida TaxID=310780 RepID=A0A1H8IQ81_9ACTN|nr:hypothetical protein [Actinacidiphila rubida]SEN70813.1 hypothetical protein SAMN05216267_1008213 [Actinacidiphila rubida]
MGDYKLPLVLPSAPVGESESLEELIGDCRRMAERWKAPATKKADAVAPAALHGITVPAASAHVVSGMADYGD